MGKQQQSVTTQWKGVEFVAGRVDADYSRDYLEPLFNAAPHRQLQSKGPWIEFHIVRCDRKKILASIFFNLKDQTALSPARAPFGSFDLSETVTAEQLFEFIGFVEAALKEQGAKVIQIKNYPEAYNPRFHNMITVLLFNHRFQIGNAELGACIQVDNVELGSKMDRWEKRKLRQAVNAGLSFKSLPVRNFEEAFDFILKCRTERGQSLSMTKSELKKVVSKLPRHFFFFGVYLGDEMIAASISIRVSKDVLYNFYSAHSKTSDRLSPVVFLISNMYDWAKDHRIKLIDLGTSALGGVPNFSLIDFKLRLAATPAMKLTFEKKLR